MGAILPGDMEGTFPEAIAILRGYRSDLSIALVILKIRRQRGNLKFRRLRVRVQHCKQLVRLPGLYGVLLYTLLGDILLLLYTFLRIVERKHVIRIVIN